jgi:curved DNA-binding protein CbpA
MHDQNLYRILQVDPDADPDVIAAAYRALATRLHPDRDFSGVDEYRMTELNRAYAVLRDPDQRHAYDRSLEGADARYDKRVPMGPGPVPASAGGSLSRRIHAPDPDGLEGIRLDFGRYEGWSLGDLLRTDPDYLRWLSRHSSGIRYRGAILRLLAEQDTHRPLRASR